MPATIIVTSLAAEKPTNSTWDITSLDSAESALSPDSSPPVKTKSSSRNNQLIKNTMPAVLNRPTKAYSMKEEDLNKREEKEKNSACPELLGFKRLTIDLSEVEPYEIGSLSPSNERTSGLKRRKSLLMPERRRLKDKLDTASLGSSSTGSAVAVKDVNMSPKSEKSYKLANGVSKKVSSPAFTRRNSRRKKKIAATNSVGLNSSAKTAPPDHQQQQTLQVTHNRIPVTDTVIDFLTNKEDLKAKLAYQGHLCSDFATLASEVPYFWRTSNSPRGGLHLVICVHGLDGNRQDLRLVNTT
ncbi:FAM135B [Bugula neritina]|uniref:FAM135B n=1 Tax=Bugula neritina TaxID=10212 RepID=A0A7J7KF62_BUGNE|nr:FAM135B [Bugula neritina]